jgi:hypothetical protein
VFNLNNDKALSKEIDIALESINGKAFRGTVTPQEAKHIIYKQCLSLELSNFDGARIGFKGGPVILFKLKSLLNVDESLPIQSCEFRQKKFKTS